MVTLGGLWLVFFWFFFGFDVFLVMVLSGIDMWFLLVLIFVVCAVDTVVG